MFEEDPAKVEGGGELGKEILSKYKDDTKAPPSAFAIAKGDASKSTISSTAFMTDSSWNDEEPSESSFGDGCTTESGNTSEYFSESATESLSLSLAMTQSLLDNSQQDDNRRRRKKRRPVEGKKSTASKPEASAEADAEAATSKSHLTSSRVKMKDESEKSTATKTRKRPSKKRPSLAVEKKNEAPTKDEEIRDYLRKDFKNPNPVVTSPENSEELTVSEYSSTTDAETDNKNNSRTTRRKQKGSTKKSSLSSKRLTSDGHFSSRNVMEDSKSTLMTDRSESLMTDRSETRMTDRSETSTGGRRMRSARKRVSKIDKKKVITEKENSAAKADKDVKQEIGLNTALEPEDKAQKTKFSDSISQNELTKRLYTPRTEKEGAKLDASASTSMEKSVSSIKSEMDIAIHKSTGFIEPRRKKTALSAASSNLHRGRSMSPASKKLAVEDAPMRRQTIDTTASVINPSASLSTSSIPTKPHNTQQPSRKQGNTKIRNTRPTLSGPKRRTSSKTPSIASEGPQKNATGQKPRAQSLSIKRPQIPTNGKKTRSCSLTVNQTPLQNEKQKIRRASETSPGGTSKATISTVRTSQSLPANVPRVSIKAHHEHDQTVLAASQKKRSKSNDPPKRNKSSDTKPAGKKQLKKKPVSTTGTDAPTKKKAAPAKTPAKKRPCTAAQAKSTASKSKEPHRRSSASIRGDKTIGDFMKKEGIDDSEASSKTHGVSLLSHIAKDSQGHNNNMELLKPVTSPHKATNNGLISPYSLRSDTRSFASGDTEGDDVYSRSEASTISGSSATATGISISSSVASSNAGASRLSTSKAAAFDQLSFLGPKSTVNNNYSISSYFDHDDEFGNSRDVFVADQSSSSLFPSSEESLVHSTAGSLLTDYSSKEETQKLRSSYQSDSTESSGTTTSGGKRKKIISPYSLHASVDETAHSTFKSQHTHDTFATPLIPDSDDEDSRGSFNAPETSRECNDDDESNHNSEKEEKAEDENNTDAAVAATSSKNEESPAPPKKKAAPLRGSQQKIIAPQISPTRKPKQGPSTKKSAVIEDFEDPTPRNSKVKKTKRTRKKFELLLEILCCRSNAAVVK